MGIRIVAAIAVILAASGAGKCYAQKLLGLVVQKNASGVDEPLPSANVHWAGTTVATTTRDNGVFLIDRVSETSRLVVSFVGYLSDTVLISDQTNVKVELKPLNELGEVTVQSWKSTTSQDYSSTINVAVMNEKELFKAACCNLSESFETNPSVDVAFTDAITGTRQIQMLGLSGPNTMISLENMPGVRGLSASQGIQFFPGTWIQSIQVTKGVGSVVNGYESIAGQINVELKKPQESEKLSLNGYVNNSGRSEANAVYTIQPTNKWGTTFLLHASARPFDMDQNHDTFLDFPKGQQVNFINRWTYHSGNGWLGQFAVKFLDDQKTGGQTGYRAKSDKFTSNRYGLEINSRRFEFTGKLGYQFAGRPYKSVGLQLNAYDHRQDSYFGFNVYDGSQRSMYVNLIYQSIISSTAHKFKTGMSMAYDVYDEQFLNLQADANAQWKTYDRTEIVPGAFFEYSYDKPGKFAATAGVRVDRHNLFGMFFTPRLHLRYDLTPTTTIRTSAGKGTRVANLLSENVSLLASSRAVVFSGQQTSKAYGFRPDEAWNYGINISQDFTLDYRSGVISVDYFYTDFVRQAVVDLYNSPTVFNVHSLSGKSFSKSLQAQVDYQLIRRLDLRMAYRLTQVKTDYDAGRLQRPLVPVDRAFVNIAYSTRNNWKFDYTVQRIGKQHLPLSSTIQQFHLPEVSPAYVLMNAQVGKDLGTHWNVYAGVENLTNYRLSNPIVSASNPFGPYFDSSMVWGPVFGRMAYAGFRYRIL